MNRKNQGFTLIELMIVVAIIAIIASIAIPNLLSSRLASNEAAAIGTLRQFIASQATLQGSGSIDQDTDGNGEYGYLAELSGGSLLQRNGPAATVLTPPVLSSAFANPVQVAAEGQIQRSGYIFKMYLSDANAAPVGEPASPIQPLGVQAAVDACETMWLAYAYPANRGTTGNRVFFVNQQGEILQTLNNVAPQFGGTAPDVPITAANALEAFLGAAPTMNSPLAVGALGQGGIHTWVPVGN